MAGGAGRPRPQLNGGGVQAGAAGRGKRAPGFNGFKAPPATDLIDQLLLEQDQDSIKRKAPGRGGFGGGFLKAPPKTDMIDALLLGGDQIDEEDDNEDSLRNDGKPA